MRVIAVLILGVVMYFGVPYIWARAMIAQVNKVASDPSYLPDMHTSVATNLTFDQNAFNAVNPTVTINTEEYEAIAVRSQGRRRHAPGAARSRPGLRRDPLSSLLADQVRAPHR
jgi:hypothetical protein